MNYFKIIFSDLVELIKVDNQNNIINENENINKNFLKFDIQEKDMKSFIQILSENNFILFI
jgi:subtilase family serine protease